MNDFTIHWDQFLVPMGNEVVSAHLFISANYQLSTTGWIVEALRPTDRLLPWDPSTFIADSGRTGCEGRISFNPSLVAGDIRNNMGALCDIRMSPRFFDYTNGVSRGTLSDLTGQLGLIYFDATNFPLTLPLNTTAVYSIKFSTTLFLTSLVQIEYAEIPPPSPVPEPAAWGGVGLALMIGLGKWGRRRRSGV